MTKRPLMLMILDGWGMKAYGEADCLALSDLPNFDRLWQEYPHTSLAASGLDVGLPDAQIGNSEVGHMNIGAGRVVYQELTLISKNIAEGGFFSNPALLGACQAARQSGGALHLLGLASDGGVHSHLDHVFALLRLAKQQGLSRVYLHCFMDGRDTATDGGRDYMARIEQYCRELGCGQVASVCGRFYAMDRDQRWERVSRAYDLLVRGQAPYRASSGLQAVEDSYAREVSDEFIEPCLIVDEQGQARASISDNDAVIFFNFRADRGRELSHALTDAEFSGFARETVPRLSAFVTLTEYDLSLQNTAVAFPPHSLENTFTQVISRHGLRQLRIAETEKYAHVTFFFNGGVEQALPGEERCLIPSPKVRTYDLQPEMSAPAVCDEVIKRIQSGVYDVIILNFANPDMVGHTGVVEAACRAVSYIDGCLGRVAAAVQQAGGSLLITADHGNVECLRLNGEPMTAHTTSRVPFILVDDDHRGQQLREQGRLEDIAPTMLRLLGIEQPTQMTGHSLLPA